MDRKPYPDEAGLSADALSGPRAGARASTRFKYSNLGFGLLGLVIEAATGEAYADWIAARGRRRPPASAETVPDLPSPGATPAGHRPHAGRCRSAGGCRSPAPPRPNALAAATGFVSTARDLALFFGAA